MIPRTPADDPSPDYTERAALLLLSDHYLAHPHQVLTPEAAARVAQATPTPEQHARIVASVRP